MLRALVGLLCAFIGISVAQAQPYLPGRSPGFRSGFQFLTAATGLPLYDFAGGTYPAVSVSRSSTGDLAADTSGTYTTFAANTLRRTNTGATIEGAQTNNNRKNTDATNWTAVAPAGMTVTNLGGGVESGIDYVDLQFSGKPTATSVRNAFENGVTISAATGQSWTNSAFWRVSAGSIADATFQIEVREYDSGSPGTGISATVFTPTSAALGTQRISHTRTLTDAGVTSVQPSWRLGVNTATTYNFTIRIGLPVTERRDNYTTPTAGTSSPIRTTGTVATRAADAVSITLPTGAGHILYTFDDGSTQQVSVSPGAYTIPTNLNRPIIARMQVQP